MSLTVNFLSSILRTRTSNSAYGTVATVNATFHFIWNEISRLPWTCWHSDTVNAKEISCRSPTQTTDMSRLWRCMQIWDELKDNSHLMCIVPSLSVSVWLCLCGVLVWRSERSLSGQRSRTFGVCSSTLNELLAHTVCLHTEHHFISLSVTGSLPSDTSAHVARILFIQSNPPANTLAPTLKLRLISQADAHLCLTVQCAYYLHTHTQTERDREYKRLIFFICYSFRVQFAQSNLSPQRSSLTFISNNSLPLLSFLLFTSFPLWLFFSFSRLRPLLIFADF